jgi:hypothetical protein
VWLNGKISAWISLRDSFDMDYQDGFGVFYDAIFASDDLRVYRKI